MIRRATAGDARELAEVQTRTWRWAYGDFVAPEKLAAYDLDTRAEHWRTSLEGPSPTWAEVVEGRIAGFATVADDELAALYVDPNAQGAGVGGGLLAHAEAELRSTGVADAWLWTLAANEHAIGFYGAKGWVRGAGEQDRGWGREIRMEKRLCSSR